MFGAVIGDLAWSRVGSSFRGGRREDDEGAADAPLPGHGCQIGTVGFAAIAVARALLDSKGDPEIIVLCLRGLLIEAGVCPPEVPVEAVDDMCPAGPCDSAPATTDQCAKEPWPSSTPAELRPWSLAKVSHVPPAAIVAPCGFFASSEDEADALAKKVAEAVGGTKCEEEAARAVAMAVFLARVGATKGEIATRMEADFPILRTDAPPDPSPQLVVCAMKAFLDADSLGGAVAAASEVPCDTGAVAAIAGNLAEAYYGCPATMVHQVRPIVDAKKRGVFRAWLKLRMKSAPVGRFALLTKYIGKLGDDARLAEFRDDFRAFAGLHPDAHDYEETLDNHGIGWDTASMQSVDAEGLGWDCAVALLAAVLDADSYAEGVLKEFVGGGHIEKWLRCLLKVDECSQPPPDAPYLDEVSVALADAASGRSGRLTLTDASVALFSDTRDGGRVHHQREFGAGDYSGTDALTTMRECLMAEGWREGDDGGSSSAFRMELLAKYEDGHEVSRSCTFDRLHVPAKQFMDFIGAVRNIVGDSAVDGLPGLDRFMAAIGPGEVKYCGVQFSKGGKVYHYRTTDPSISVGDKVIVPVGDDGGEREVVVATIDFCRWDNPPYPLKQTKEVKAKASGVHIVDAEIVDSTARKPLRQELAGHRSSSAT